MCGAGALYARVLPAGVLKKLKSGQGLTPDSLSEVTVLFGELLLTCDGELPPRTLLTILNIVFTAFDDLVAMHGMYKIETVGEVYLAAAGVPEPVADHAARAANMALAMLAVLMSLLWFNRIL